jgi:tRNA(adenine34) deaminase
MNDLRWMAEAVAEARRAAELGEVPIGAVVVDAAGEIVSRAHNTKETTGDPLGHAEILALRQASARLGGWRLSGCTLYVTLEPCAMCAGALVASRVQRLVFATEDPKAGFCGSLGNLVQDRRLNHRLEVTSGVMREECSALLKEFFVALRRGVGVSAIPEAVAAPEAKAEV